MVNIALYTGHTLRNFSCWAAHHDWPISLPYAFSFVVVSGPHANPAQIKQTSNTAPEYNPTE